MKRFNAVLLALAVAGASASQPSAQQRPIEDFFRDFSAEWARGNPNQAVSTRYFTGELQDRLERQLTPLTSAWQRQRIDVARRGLAELRRMGRAAFIDQQAIAAELLEWQLDTIVQGESFIDFAFPLEQFQGANVRLVNTLTVAHPLRTEQDADNYLARLAQVGLRMQEAVARARRIAADGILPPRFILRATIAQMEQFIASPPAQNPFVTAFEGRLAAAKAVPDQLRRAALRTEAERIVGAHVYPAWQNAIALLEQQLEQATDDAGLWRLRGGAEAYAYHLRRHTTTNLTAEEIHLIGLREVARIEAEMDAILKKLGRSEGSVNDRIAQLRRDLSYPLTDEGRMAIMADIDMTIRDAEKRSAEQFDVRPRAQVVSQAYPRFREATAAAGVHDAAARWIASGRFPDSVARSVHDKISAAVARVPRDDTWPSLSDRTRSGKRRAAEVSSRAALWRGDRAHRRVGAVRRAPRGRVGVVRGGPRRAARPARR